MASELVHVERRGNLAIVRFDRPPANALEREAVVQIGAAFAEIETDASAGAIVFTGTGSFFSAGVDLKAVPAYGPPEQRAMVDELNRMIGRVYGYPLPVVGAINGHAIAGGMVCALLCDHRVGARGRFQIGLTEARVAIPFPMAAMEVVRAELPPAQARRFVLRARNTDPEGALAAGALDELCDPEALLPRALDVARELAALPRAAYGRIKRQLRGPALARIEDCVERGTDPLRGGWLGDETRDASAGTLASAAAPRPQPTPDGDGR